MAEETNGLSERQQAVLDAALSLLVEQGDMLTMTAVAQRASCSKETLYKWFGGRAGLLTATVRHQASRVRAVPYDVAAFDRSTLEAGLEAFAVDLLDVIGSATSIALNRLAVGKARDDDNDLGHILLRNGPDALRARLRPLLELGRSKGLLAFDGVDEVFSTFFGLVVRDTQLRALLGDADRPGAEAVRPHAQRAVRQFLTLYTPSR